MIKIEIDDKYKYDSKNFIAYHHAKFSKECGIVTLEDFIKWFKSTQKRHHHESVRYLSRENNCMGDILERVNGECKWYISENFWRKSIYWTMPVELIEIRDGWGEYEYVLMFI